MNKTTLISMLCGVLLTACNKPKHAYYELENGDPHIDFIEFVNDSVVRYIGPEGMEHQDLYVEQDNEIKIEITPLVKVTLKRIDANTLKGIPPFFEGTWKKKEKK